MQANITHRSATLRILDANANRAAEGLRTLEETARFILSAYSLTSELKDLRHQLAGVMQRLPRADLLRHRDTAGDVGTAATTPSERSRSTIAGIVAAASSRIQQSLRCLEEYGKLIDAEFAAEIEQIRYRSYDVCSRLEQICLSGKDRHTRLHRSRLYALIDASESQDRMIRRIRALADCGVDIIQLRAPGIDDRTLYERAVAGASVARDVNVLWIINDRADIAAASGADGVHVGQQELPVEQVRQIVGAEALIGLSTHDVQELRQAATSTADYLGCGPVFPGQTKQFDTFPGCAFLRAAVSEWKSVPTPLPAFAIGGITALNVHQVVAAGFGRIAVTAALAESADLQNTAQLLREALSAIELPEFQENNVLQENDDV